MNVVKELKKFEIVHLPIVQYPKSQKYIVRIGISKNHKNLILDISVQREITQSPNKYHF